MKSDFNAKHYLTGQVFEGTGTAAHLIRDVRLHLFMFKLFTRILESSTP